MRSFDRPDATIIGLPFDLSASRVLRTAIETRFGQDPWVADACLVASELSTNAVIHGSPPVVAVIADGPGILVAVADGAAPDECALALPAGEEAATLPPPMSESGRGLPIVARIAHHVTVEPFVHEDGTRGKVVAAELAGGDEAPAGLA